jgi:hypothetical protein
MNFGYWKIFYHYRRSISYQVTIEAYAQVKDRL